MNAPPIELPRVNPTGIVTYPPGFTPSARPRRPLLRLAAALMLVVFAVVVVATTVLSLGRYCLTSDGSNTRALEIGLPKQPAPENEAGARGAGPTASEHRPVPQPTRGGIEGQ